MFFSSVVSPSPIVTGMVAGFLDANSHDCGARHDCGAMLSAKIIYYYGSLKGNMTC